MKVLIWVLSVLIGTLINTLLGEITGFRTAALLLYLVEFFLAGKLCEKWDAYKIRKGTAAFEAAKRADRSSSNTHSAESHGEGSVSEERVP